MEKINFTENVRVNTVSQSGNEGVFTVEGLYRGYGLTLGNALRRILLSSLPGAAITKVKVTGVGHEFTTIPGVIEDVVEIMLNLKKVRFSFPSESGFMEPQIITLKAKGEGPVAAAAIKGNAQVSVVNEGAHLFTISQKGTEVEMELTVEKGLGYVSSEAMKNETMPVGVIHLDALFSPVVKVNFTVENMRVNDRTDFNRLNLMITTDGGVEPKAALTQAFAILRDHASVSFDQLGGAGATGIAAAEPEAEEGASADEEAGEKSSEGGSSSGGKKAKKASKKAK